MANGNWTANPGPQSEAAQTDKDRGNEESFPASNSTRKTGYLSGGMETPKVVPVATTEPVAKRPKP